MENKSCLIDFPLRPIPDNSLEDNTCNFTPKVPKHNNKLLIPMTNYSLNHTKKINTWGKLHGFISYEIMYLLKYRKLVLLIRSNFGADFVTQKCQYLINKVDIVKVRKHELNTYIAISECNIKHII